MVGFVNLPINASLRNDYFYRIQKLVQFFHFHRQSVIDFSKLCKVNRGPHYITVEYFTLDKLSSVMDPETAHLSQHVPIVSSSCNELMAVLMKEQEVS